MRTRIDRAVEAALQAERERVSRELFAVCEELEAAAGLWRVLWKLAHRIRAGELEAPSAPAPLRRVRRAAGPRASA